MLVRYFPALPHVVIVPPNGIGESSSNPNRGCCVRFRTNILGMLRIYLFYLPTVSHCFHFSLSSRLEIFSLIKMQLKMNKARASDTLTCDLVPALPPTPTFRTVLPIQLYSQGLAQDLVLFSNTSQRCSTAESSTQADLIDKSIILRFEPRFHGLNTNVLTTLPYAC